jgi:propionate CoA-transferase
VRDPILMDTRLFRQEPMGLEHILLGLALAERLSYDSSQNTIFLNFEGFHLRTLDDVELIRREMETRCRAIGKRVALIVNYDGFTLDPAASDAYFSLVAYLESRYYSTVSRYTTSAFMRFKLGAELAERALAPHVFETLSEARAAAAEMSAKGEAAVARLE